MPDSPLVALVMGVAGVGKTSVGRRAAVRLGWDFVDGDDFHSPSSVEKMKRGIPLTDSDRRRWLNLIRAIMTDDNLWLFITRPISGGLLLVAVISVVLSIWQHMRHARRTATVEPDF